LGRTGTFSSDSLFFGYITRELEYFSGHEQSADGSGYEAR